MINLFEVEIFYSGDEELIRMRIENGANVNAVSKSGETALIIATDKGERL